MTDKTSATAIPKFFTIEQIAESLSVSTRTVRRWIESRILRVHRPGRLVRISEADFAAFLAIRSNAVDCASTGFHMCARR